MSKIAIFGTSGFAKETADICTDLGYKDIVLIAKDLVESKLCKNSCYKVFTEKDLNYLAGSDYFFIIGIGDNYLRNQIYNKYSELKYINLIHPTATFGNGQLNNFTNKKGNIVAAGVRFTNNIKIGDFGIFNLNATVGHDVEINDFVNVSPGANISGNVILSNKIYIGTNAAIINGKSIDKKLYIGAGVIVGAGAVVTKDVKDGATVVGMPAREVSGN